MNGYKCLVVFLLSMGIQACAGGPGKPGEAPLTQPDPVPSHDYIYRSPPPAVAQALR